MGQRIFTYRNNVTLLGGAPVSRETFEESRQFAPVVLAADGGARAALGWGHVPELVIGDMDSLDRASRAMIPQNRLVTIREQESTDFDKVLRLVDAPLILGLGFIGARLDHSLACLAGLVRLPDRRCVLVGPDDVVFHATGDISMDLPPGSRLSLFPMAPVRVFAAGLVWPVDGLEMQPWGQIGTSNAVGPGGQMRLSVEGPGLLVIVPRAALGAVVDALG